MDDINNVVAGNLRQLREERGLSLAQAAREAGVSKSLLSQIERGEVNPTISTVWKIAAGLKVTFTRLTTRPAEEFEIVDTRTVRPILADEGRFHNYPLFGLAEDTPFELYYLDLDPGAFLAAEPHLPGAREYVTIITGELTVTAGERELTAGPGVALRFPADRPHSYRAGGERCLVSMVIYYPR